MIPLVIIGGGGFAREVLDIVEAINDMPLELATAVLLRLPADRAIVNRLGFPNEGASRVVDRLHAH